MKLTHVIVLSRRLKFMMSGPPGTEIFISSDMFFLEVLLEPSGHVREVKIHHEGKSEQQVSVANIAVDPSRCVTFCILKHRIRRAARYWLLACRAATLSTSRLSWRDWCLYIS